MRIANSNADFGTAAFGLVRKSPVVIQTRLQCGGIRGQH
jgi:hypothetical protein